MVDALGVAEEIAEENADLIWLIASVNVGFAVVVALGVDATAGAEIFTGAGVDALGVVAVTAFADVPLFLGFVGSANDGSA